MLNKTHPHAELIAGWTTDTSQKIEVLDRSNDNIFRWQEVSISFVIDDKEGKFKFRFAANIVSSLTDEELLAIAEATNPYQGIYCTAYRAIADAAAQRAIEELEIPQEWLATHYTEPRDFILIQLALKKYLTALKDGSLSE